MLYTPSPIGSVPAEGLDPGMGGLVLCISPSSAGSVAAGLPHARLGKAAGGAATEGEALSGKRHRPTRKLPGPSREEERTTGSPSLRSPSHVKQIVILSVAPPLPGGDGNRKKGERTRLLYRTTEDEARRFRDTGTCCFERPSKNGAQIKAAPGQGGRASLGRRGGGGGGGGLPGPHGGTPVSEKSQKV